VRADFHKRIMIGVEIEAYSIGLNDHQIGRKLSRPRRGLSEEGERFTRDASIGSEYNSRPFSTVRESLFLLKGGLRKYLRRLYRSRRPSNSLRVPLLVGGWTNRFAGTHLHISVDGRRLSRRGAARLAFPIHDHLPLLIAVGANSPVWDRQLTPFASNRLLKGSKYFAPLRRGQVGSGTDRELCFVPGRKTKPATLEIRALDSNIPEFVVAAICLVKAVCLRWLRGGPATNRISFEDYLQSRQEAARRGLRARLCWKGEWLPARDYLDRFLWEHREELECMDVPDEVYHVLRWVKKGYNGARLIREAARLSQKEHPQTWQRRFARRYARGLEVLLSGNTINDFAASLRIEPPSVDRVWLGRRRASIDE
jgi:hypothetical protein